MEPLQNLLIKANASPLHSANEWIQYGKHLEVYARVQLYMLNETDNTPTKVLTLATIVIGDSSKRGKGLFTEFLAYAEKATELPIVVENVLNPYLDRFLLRNGFCLIHKAMPDLVDSYFKLRK